MRASSRYEVVDSLIRKWLYRHGGDPSKYKKKTKAFDAVATLTDSLVRQHVLNSFINALLLYGFACTQQVCNNEPYNNNTTSRQVHCRITHMESMGMTGMSTMLASLETALKHVSDIDMPLGNRIGPAIAALLNTVDVSTVESPETMSSLIKSLVDEEHPLTQETINGIDSFDIVEDIKDCGINLPDEEMFKIVDMVLDCLKAQILDPEEVDELNEKVEQALKGEDVVKPEQDTKDKYVKKTGHSEKFDIKIHEDEDVLTLAPIAERKTIVDRSSLVGTPHQSKLSLSIETKKSSSDPPSRVSTDDKESPPHSQTKLSSVHIILPPSQDDEDKNKKDDTAYKYTDSD